MDFKNRHPLNAIDGYENLSMLEVLIPFVEPSLKLPFALFIKFSEIRLIINCFRSIDNLTRLGLHNTSSDPLDMICALTGTSPDLLKTMFSMMDGNNLNNMMSMLQNMPSGVKTSSNTSDYFNQETDSSKRTVSGVSDDSFEQNIQNLLAEYDLAQAAEYHSEFNTHYDKDNSSYERYNTHTILKEDSL